MSKLNIILAAPQPRYDFLKNKLESSSSVNVLRVYSPEELLQEKIEEFSPRYIFFPQWSWKVPASVFSAYECIMFHMTDLPFGRGGSPLQNLIALGLTETHLSALRCVEEMDAGPIYMQLPLSLLGTAEEILMRAACLIEKMITHILQDQPEPHPQKGEPVIFHRRKAQDGNIAQLETLEKVFDFIRMLDGAGYPPAFIENEHFRFEFSRASLKPEAVFADVRITFKSSKL